MIARTNGAQRVRIEQQADAESRAADEHHLALRVWLRFLACTNIVQGRTRAALRQEFDSTLPRFDLMAQLERFPSGLKMSDISKRMMVTGGNVTGITDQLVSEGLVSRRSAPLDRRAYTVRLTPAGRRAFREMARAHERWIVSMFGGLTKSETGQLHALLAKLKQHLMSRPNGAAS
ncbi:MAG TPA: MarR family transcriptional regulator [Candidatus Eremiobacteraceae bacterium]|nr:MarR family transcriptional regulator [Candidatus Eremiobacteraceae bacterium]